MSKDARLTIRMNEALDQWLGEQAEQHGLDKAAYARMVLFRAMNGHLDVAIKAAHPAMVVDEHGVVEPLEQPPGAVTYVEDVDALVASAAALARSQPARPVAQEEQDPMLAELGMRAFHLPPPPHFGDRSRRITRLSSWVTG